MGKSIQPMDKADAEFWRDRRVLTMAEWLESRRTKAPWWRRLFHHAASSANPPSTAEALPTTDRAVEAGPVLDPSTNG